MQLLVIALSAVYPQDFCDFLSAVSFENLFFRFLPRWILYMEYSFGQLCDRTYFGQFLHINRCTESVFHLNNRVNFPLNLRYFSRNSSILQVFAHHIPDKLAVSFNSSSSLLSSYKWFLTIGSKYSFVKAYNVEI